MERKEILVDKKLINSLLKTMMALRLQIKQLEEIIRKIRVEGCRKI